MSDFNNNTSNEPCNYCRNLNPANITITSEEINNNVININNLERSNNNTIVIIQQNNSGTPSTESNSDIDKEVQTTPEDFEDSEDTSGEETKVMEDGHNNINPQYVEDMSVTRPKIIQANGNKPNALTVYNAYYNNDDPNNKATDMTYNRNATEHRNYVAENEQYDDEGELTDVSIINNSPITEILSHSQRNKALINSVLKNFSNEAKVTPLNYNQAIIPDKNLINQPVLKNMFDIIRREKSKIDENKKFTIESFTQTVIMTMQDKYTQTITYNEPNTKGNNRKRNSDEGAADKNLMSLMNGFMQQTLKYFDDYQTKQKQLIQQYNIQIENFNNKYGRISMNESLNVNNTPNPASGATMANVGIPANGNHPAFGAHANPAYPGNTAATSYESRLFNTVNPMPRQGQTGTSERATPPRPPRPYSVNPTIQVRGVGRPRTNPANNARYTPYPTPPWPQGNAPNRRPAPQVLEFEDANAIPYPPNAMMAQYNGWPVPNNSNAQTFFPPQHPPF